MMPTDFAKMTRHPIACGCGLYASVLMKEAVFDWYVGMLLGLSKPTDADGCDIACNERLLDCHDRLKHLFAHLRPWPSYDATLSLSPFYQKILLPSLRSATNTTPESNSVYQSQEVRKTRLSIRHGTATLNKSRPQGKRRAC